VPVSSRLFDHTKYFIPVIWQEEKVKFLLQMSVHRFKSLAG